MDRCAQLSCQIQELQRQLYQLGNAILSQSIASVKQTYIAAQTISGGKAVIIDVDGKIYAFDILNPYHYDKYLGIAETGSTLGTPIVIVTNGPTTLVGTGWLPGVQYYIGGDSFLTSVPPVSGFVKIVGIGINTNVLLVESGVGVIVS
jgi:hypothetical protein